MSYTRKTREHRAAASRHRRRLRRTFSLAPEVVHYVEQVQERQNTPSLSAAFEAIVRAQQQEEQRQRLSAEIGAYYDSMSEQEAAEEKAWGELAGRALLEGSGS